MSKTKTKRKRKIQAFTSVVKAEWKLKHLTFYLENSIRSPQCHVKQCFVRFKRKLKEKNTVKIELLNRYLRSCYRKQRVGSKLNLSDSQQLSRFIQRNLFSIVLVMLTINYFILHYFINRKVIFFPQQTKSYFS